MQLVAVDLLGPLPESNDGNSYILVVADYFTRWAEAFAVPNQEASTVLTNEFFFRFSPPEQLHSDQGKQFESELLAELLGINKTPQSDGRFNRTLLSMLATAGTEYPFNWQEHLRPLCMAYNTSVHPTTGFFLMFGRQARMPIDVAYGPPPSTTASSPSEFATQLRQRLQKAYERVREKLGQRLYDPYAPDDLVWLHSQVPPKGCPWTGPYRVINKLADTVYRIQHTTSRRRRPVVHFNRLIFVSRQTPHVPGQQILQPIRDLVPISIFHRMMIYLRPPRRTHNPPQPYLPTYYY